MKEVPGRALAKLRDDLAAERETSATYRQMYEAEASHAGSLTAQLGAEREKVARLRAVIEAEAGYLPPSSRKRVRAAIRELEHAGDPCTPGREGKAAQSDNDRPE